MYSSLKFIYGSIPFNLSYLKSLIKAYLRQKLNSVYLRLLLME